MSVQNFGEKFDLEKLIKARNLAKQIAYETRDQIKPGMTEADAYEIYKGLCDKYGINKQWHPPKFRFGPNTLLNFKDKSQDYTLQENDIFFIDIGPIINDHEADFGETFFVGSNLEHKRICDLQQVIFNEVRDYWQTTYKSGMELYEYAKNLASSHDVILNIDQDGHRIGDFPHHIYYNGSLQDFEMQIVPNAWILEIHLWDKEKRFGAFYEDLLTDYKLI